MTKTESKRRDKEIQAFDRQYEAKQREIYLGLSADDRARIVKAFAEGGTISDVCDKVSELKVHHCTVEAVIRDALKARTPSA